MKIYKAKSSGKRTFRGTTKNGNKKRTSYKPFQKGKSINKTSRKTQTVFYTPTIGKNKGKRMVAKIVTLVSIKRSQKK